MFSYPYVDRRIYPRTDFPFILMTLGQLSIRKQTAIANMVTSFINDEPVIADVIEKKPLGS